MVSCGVEELVPRWTNNPKAASSSLAPDTKLAILLLCSRL